MYEEDKSNYGKDTFLLAFASEKELFPSQVQDLTTFTKLKSQL